LPGELKCVFMLYCPEIYDESASVLPLIRYDDLFFCLVAFKIRRMHISALSLIS
jgi:hypothetical protein